MDEYIYIFQLYSYCNFQNPSSFRHTITDPYINIVDMLCLYIKYKSDTIYWELCSFRFSIKDWSTWKKYFSSMKAKFAYFMKFVH